jgi:hypothetical protein
MFRFYVLMALIAIGGVTTGVARAAAGAATGTAAMPAMPPILSENDPRNKLHLTTDQQKQMQAILLKAQAQAQAIGGDTKTTPQQKQALAETLRTQVQAQELAILTPEQKTEVQTHQAAEMQIAKQAQALVADRQKLLQQLSSSYTPAQKTKLQAMNASMPAFIQQLQNDKSLTNDQRAAKFHTQQLALLAQEKQVLTASQKAIADKINADDASLADLQRQYEANAE